MRTAKRVELFAASFFHTLYYTVFRIPVPSSYYDKLLLTPMSQSPNRGKVQVSLLNIDSQPPIKDGVNTPRSCNICARLNVNPKDLVFKDVEEFKGPKVTDAAAALRQRSYERKRQALLAKLIPERKKFKEGKEGEGSASRSPNRSNGGSPPRNVDESIANAQERHSAMLSNNELTGLDLLLQKEVHSMDVLKQRHEAMQRRKIELYNERRAKQEAAERRRRFFEEKPSTSPLRKSRG